MPLFGTSVAAMERQENLAVPWVFPEPYPKHAGIYHPPQSIVAKRPRLSGACPLLYQKERRGVKQNLMLFYFWGVCAIDVPTPLRVGIGDFPLDKFHTPLRVLK